MKKLLSLILFLVFALHSCEKEPDPPNPINDALDFNELISLMGGELDQLRDMIPGHNMRETIYPDGDIFLRYHMIPAVSHKFRK